MGIFGTLPHSKLNVFGNWYRSNSDPMDDPDITVKDGDPWIQTTNDTSPYGPVLGLSYADNGAWVGMLSSGPDGDPGPQGDPGSDGTDGSQIRSVSGVPSDGLGEDGDWAIDIVTANMYQKEVGTYVLKLNISGTAAVSDTAYDAAVWNGITTFAPSKNAVRDKIEAVVASIPVASDVAYDATTWDANTDAPTKNAVRDKIEAVVASIPVASDVAYDATTWNANTDAPTKNAVRDKIEAVVASIPVASDVAYDAATWNANTDAPTKNAVRDKIEAVVASIPVVSDTAYDATTWNANTDAPSKNAVRDKFESLSAGGGLTLVSKVFSDSPYTAAVDGFVKYDASSGASTVNLPAASGNSGKQIHVKKVDSSANYVTIDANSTETIDGALTYILTTQYESVSLICDGSNWLVM